MSDNPKISYPIGGKNVQGGLPTANQILQFNVLTNLWEFVIPTAVTNTFARVVKKVAEIVNNDTVLHDDNELFVPIKANTHYAFQLMLLVDSPVPADFKYTFTIPGAGIGNIIQGSPSSTVAASALSITDVTVIPTSGAGQFLLIFGSFLPFADGDFQLQWAQNASNAGDTAIRQTSSLIVWEELP